MAFKLRLTPAAAAVVLLAACGGGGSNSNLTPVLNPTGGVAVDGYLSFAKIVCDANENGVADVGEAAVFTLVNGKFVFPQGCSSSLLASGGKNADTGLLFAGLLRAPAGATVISPLTTLMAAGMTQAQMNAALGLPAGTNLLMTDPAAMAGGSLVEPLLLKKTLAVQQLLQKVAESLAGLAGASGSATIQPIFREVAAAFASVMASSTRLIVNDTAVDEAVVQALVKAAADRVSQASPVIAEVKAAIRQVNTTALAGMTAGALKTQADAILNATDAASITAATLAQQGSEVITNYVYQNKGQLAGAPLPGTIAALGNALTSQVAAGTAPPPPAGTGTVLISFDEAVPAFSNMGAYAGALPSVVAGPTGGSGNALKIVKPANPETFGGVYFGTANIPFTATRKTITARVFSTRANAVISLKAEATDGSWVEVLGTATGLANTWQTVTWVLSGINTAKTYNLFAITPDASVVATGQTYYLDDITLAPAAVVAPPAPTNYLALVGDAISLSNGSASTPYSMTAFQSAGGINLSWPLASTVSLNLNLSEVGTFVLAPNQTVNAAVSITETSGGQGEVKAYIENVSVTKTASGLVVTVPNLASAMVYGVSGDGSKKAVVDFSNGVSNITNTLSLAASATNSILVGNVANYAINQLSNDFTGINSLRGKYAVTIVIDGLPLKKADGSALPALSVVVPTSLGANGAVLTSKPVTGVGLTGFITLTN